MKLGGLIAIFAILIQNIYTIGSECAKLTEGNFFDIGALKSSE